MRDNGEAWFKQRLAAGAPSLTATCDRCGQPCAPRSDDVAAVLPLFRRMLNADREIGLTPQETPLLCAPCYRAHRELRGKEACAAAERRRPYDAVERYERLVDAQGRGGEKAPAPAEFFSKRTLDGELLSTEYFNRMNTAIRRARAGAARGTGDM